ncbi:MAG: hypothetical protein WCI77_06520 [Candidatus Omnitrophota bacterium]
MKYDVLLCLSGGKDSCSLACKLKEKGLSILAFTNDVGFMSPVALENIRKLVDVLEIDHLMFRPKPSVHKKIIDEYFSDSRQSLEDVCGRCASLMAQAAAFFARAHGINTIVSGFTKYHAQALQADRGMQILPKMDMGGITALNPYCKFYNLKKIEQMLKKFDIVTDPTQTNCKFLPKIIATDIKRFGKCSMEDEFNLLLQDKQITQEEYTYYRKWVTKEFKL